jgi:hypothetical protein
MYQFITNINHKSPHNKYSHHSQKNIPYTITANMEYAKTVSLFSQPYLDKYNQCYKNIVVVNLKPQGPLGELVHFTHFPPLSEFQEYNNCSPNKNCGFAIRRLGNCYYNNCKDDFMRVDEIPDLISFLTSNGYTIDTDITKMFNTSDIQFNTNTGNKLICFITYHGL